MRHQRVVPTRDPKARGRRRQQEREYDVVARGRTRVLLRQVREHPGLAKEERCDSGDEVRVDVERLVVQEAPAAQARDRTARDGPVRVSYEGVVLVPDGQLLIGDEPVLARSRAAC